MKMQFGTGSCAFLRCKTREIQNQEQTLELRLNDEMPDIGRVLCAWGQVLLRSKEWLSDTIRVSGGVHAWVLYAPEGGGTPCCVEGWLPFQGKWNIPSSDNDGSIRIQCQLRAIDGRTLSARKIMVRTSVGMLAEAFAPEKVEVYSPEELPGGVEVLRRRYPVCMMREAGEKAFTMEEEVMLSPAPWKILCCRACPVVTEQAVMGTRLILRGFVRLHTVCQDEQGRIYTDTQELPFAQFAELDKEYDKEATAQILPQMASLECNLMADRLLVKCGVVAQYIICDRTMLELAEDAYSLEQKLTPQIQQLQLPVILDTTMQKMDLQLELPAEAEKVIDMTFCADHPVQYQQEDGTHLEAPGVMQILYYDREGNMQAGTATWNGHHHFAACETCELHISVGDQRGISASILGDRIRITGEQYFHIHTAAQQAIPMITALELGESITPDPARPSMILRRAGQKCLWELARECGSTVEAILKANQLTDEPAADLMLLIPVI